MRRDSLREKDVIDFQSSRGAVDDEGMKGEEHIGSTKPVIAAIAFATVALVLFVVLIWIVEVIPQVTLAIKIAASFFSFFAVVSTCYLLTTHVVSGELEYASYRGSSDPESNRDWLKLLLSLRRRRYVMRLLSLVLVYTTLAGVAVWTSSGMVAVIMTELIACYEAFVTLTFYKWIVIQFADGTEISRRTRRVRVQHESGGLKEGMNNEGVQQERGGDETQGGGDSEQDCLLHGPLTTSRTGEAELLKSEGDLLIVATSKFTRVWPALVYQLRQRLMDWLRERERSGECHPCSLGCSPLRCIVNSDGFWNLFSNVAVVSLSRTFLSLYLVANVCLALVVIVCLPLGLYKDGNLSTNNNVYPFIYLIRLQFMSPALFSLLCTLIVARHPLKSLSPVKKFATVKLIVFLGVWQRVILTFNLKFHHVPSGVTPGDSVPLLNNALLCLEMFIAIFINFRVFRALPSYSTSASGLDGLVQELLPPSQGFEGNDTPNYQSAAREGDGDGAIGGWDSPLINRKWVANGSADFSNASSPPSPQAQLQYHRAGSPSPGGPRWKNSRQVAFSPTLYLFTFSDLFLDVRTDLGYVFFHRNEE